MKHFLKTFIITASSLYITTRVVPTISIGYDIKNYLVVVLGLWIITLVVKPLFSLVLLPVNILTFGFVSFLLNITLVFALLNFLPQFSVSAYYFPGAEVEGIIFPAISFNDISTIILVSTIITLLQKVLHIIFE